MDILLFNLFITICIFIFSSIFLNRRKEVLLYAITLILLLSPSTVMLGFGNDSIFNVYFSYFFILFIIPLIFIYYKGIFRKKKILSSYYKQIGKYLVIIILIKFVLSISRLFSYGVNPIIDFSNSSKEFILILILTYFYYSILHLLDNQEQIQFIKRIIFSFVILSALFGFLVQQNLFPFNFIQETFYEFKFSSIGRDEISMYERIHIDLRSYSFFSAANQFGSFAAIAISISTVLYKRKHVSILYFFIVFISCLIIIYCTQSRTAFFFFFFFLLVTLFAKFNVKTLIFFLLFFISVFFFAELLPDRILESFNSDNLKNIFEKQRFSFWIEFFNSFKINREFIFHGFYNQTFLKNNLIFFESGILNFISKNGLLIFLVFYFFIFRTIIISKKHSHIKYNNSTLSILSFWVIIILVLGEIFQGWFINLRYETITSIFLVLPYLKNKK